jgi:hypothetical protein
MVFMEQACILSIETTGRVGVLLDFSESIQPIAVKPENLHMFAQELK